MASVTYTVRAGDSLWKIASANKSKISGSTINAKIDTLVKLNKIKNRNLIYIGQKLILSSDGSSTSSETTKSNKVDITAIALKAGDTTGRALIAVWKWSKDNTKGFKYRWSQYVDGIWQASDGSHDIPEDTPKDRYDEYNYAEFNADAEATKVRLQVLPVARTYKKNNEEVPYWKEGTGDDDVAWATKEYDFSNNPPFEPGAPSVEFDELNDKMLVMKFDNIDAEKLNAKYVRFKIIKDNTSSIHTSENVTIKTNSVEYKYEVEYGADYKVCACCVGSDGKTTSTWSDYSASVGTKPRAPKEITVWEGRKLEDDTFAAYLEWTKVTNAATYRIEYTTLLLNFEQNTNVDGVDTTDAKTNFHVTGLEPGKVYYFRVRAVNSKGVSEPCQYVILKLGEPPAAPTTWSTANSVFVGETMELNWTHNARDGSVQTKADLGIKIGDGEWITEVLLNTTKTSDTAAVETAHTQGYGTAISYKGSLYFKMDTEHARFKDQKIQWRVRTAGVTGSFSANEDDWSTIRTIYIYDMPTLNLSVTKDMAGEEPLGDVTIDPADEGYELTDPDETMPEPVVIRKALTQFPFYIRASVDLDSYEIQRPIGYQIRIVAKDYYETVDDTGRSIIVNPDDEVYNKYFNINNSGVEEIEFGNLVLEMSANTIDLEPLIRYAVYCSVDMSSGLTITNEDEFNVVWEDNVYTIGADITVDSQAYTTAIMPYCVDAEDNFVENVSLSIYRREYNGTLTEIATNIPNGGTAVSDPHPSLDYARYRLIAKDTNTGAISFYDMPGKKIGATSLVIQWDEDWAPFDASAENSIEPPKWTGSMLVLPYNTSVSDNRTRETALVNYAGREFPVSYHGTKITETSQWSTVIPKNDTETIYALRRLSLWSGIAYVREPSGMGFWARVTPKFDIKYGELTISVNLDITRVEGGV